MKTIALTLFAAALGCAQNQSSAPAPAPAPAAGTAPASTAAPKTATAAKNKKPAQPTTQQKAAAQSQAQSIPTGATRVEPNLYRYTDSNGKTWNYRQTPFGISRWEATSSSAPEASAETTPAKRDPVTVTDLGDSYRFEKKTPFGQSTWVRKKSALTDEEKALTVDQQTQSNPSQGSVDSKPAGNQ
jgi:hypothetical protein